MVLSSLDVIRIASQINEMTDEEMRIMSEFFFHLTAQVEKLALNSLQPKPYRRETPQYTSLNSTEYNTYKKNVMQYTGDKMKGIGTLHKSNAVPIFTDEEAKDQANMRR